jgi:hypothetical protein
MTERPRSARRAVVSVFGALARDRALEQLASS